MKDNQLSIFDAIPDVYHNTVNLSGIALQKRQMRATSQGFKILQFFRDHPGLSFTPFEIQQALALDNVPITSIRRAMTNLTPGYLIKTNDKKPGIYGDLNYTWTIKNET